MPLVDPGEHVICPQCGAEVMIWSIHQDYHKAIERIRAIVDAMQGNQGHHG